MIFVFILMRVFSDSIYGIVNNFGKEIEQDIDIIESINLVRRISKYSSMPFVVKKEI